MRNNKYVYLLFLALLGIYNSYGQEEITEPQKKSALVLYLSGGAGYYAANAGAPAYLNPTIMRINPLYTARIMWHPDHLLRLGMETGYITFYSYDLIDSTGQKGNVALNAVPVLIEWSMPVTKRFNIYVGSGLYFLNSKLKYAGKANSNKISTGWMTGASYIQPIFKDLALGTEFKWLYASETTSGSLSLQLQLVYRFLKW